MFTFIIKTISSISLNIKTIEEDPNWRHNNYPALLEKRTNEFLMSYYIEKIPDGIYLVKAYETITKNGIEQYITDNKRSNYFYVYVNEMYQCINEQELLKSYTK